MDSFSKIFFIIYGAIGIPLTLHVINTIVNELTKPTKYFMTMLNFHLGHIYQPFKIKMIHFGIMCKFKQIKYILKILLLHMFKEVFRSFVYMLLQALSCYYQLL